LEIGVAGGGSLELWSSYLGQRATVVGIDSLQDSRTSNINFKNPNIHFEVGDQADRVFLSGLIQKFGEFDIVIDDGSHLPSDVIASFEAIYPHVSKNGIYIVEDVHASYFKTHQGGLKKPGTFIEFLKGKIDELHSSYIGNASLTRFTTETESISIHDSMVIFKKGGSRWKSTVNSHDPFFTADSNGLVRYTVGK